MQDKFFIPVVQTILEITNPTNGSVEIITADIQTGDENEAPTMESIVEAIDDVLFQYADIYEVPLSAIRMVSYDEAIEKGWIEGD